MSETPDITNLFRSKHDSWDPDSELGSIIYLTREPITKIPTKAIVIASNEVMKSRGNNCKIVSRDPRTAGSRNRSWSCLIRSSVIMVQVRSWYGPVVKFTIFSTGFGPCIPDF